MQTLWETRTTARRMFYPVTLVPRDALSGRTGFQSVYGYPPETAKVINENNSTADLDDMPLFSDTLFVDFDNNDDAALAAADKLAGYTFDMYNTGGRGYHLHFPIAPMYGLGLPAAQKAWVAANCPGADLSIYKTSGVIRLPGTFHAKKPGQCKALVKQNVGTLLVIPTVSNMAPTADTAAAAAVDKDKDKLLGDMLFKMVREGTIGRNQYAFRIACVARDAGYPLQETVGMVTTWNATCCVPALKPQEVVNACHSAYKKVLRNCR